MPSLQPALVIENRNIAPGIWHMKLQTVTLAQEVQPGQFVQVRVSKTVDPLLRTPLSVHDCDREQRTIELLYHVIGVSTQLLSHYEAGEYIDLLGPLGRGFALPAKDQSSPVFLTAGGMGIAPLLFLAKELTRRGVPTRLFYGARFASALVQREKFTALGVKVDCCTDDGSQGLEVNVVELLTARLSEEVPAEIFACGPRPMLKAMQQLARDRSLPLQFSLEEYMACGLGACLGCAVPTPSGTYVHVCTDGPVFRESEVQL